MASIAPSPDSSPSAIPPIYPTSFPNQTADTPPPVPAPPDNSIASPLRSPQLPLPTVSPQRPPQLPLPETPMRPPPPPNPSPPPLPPALSPLTSSVSPTPSSPTVPPPLTIDSPPPPILPPSPEEAPALSIAPPPPQPETGSSPPTYSPSPLSIAQPPKKSPSWGSSPSPPNGSPSPTTSNPPSIPTVSPVPTFVPPSTFLSPPSASSSSKGSMQVAPQRASHSEEPTARSTQASPNMTVDLTSRNSQGLKAGSVAVIGSIVGLLALTLVALVVWLSQKRKKRADKFDIDYEMPHAFASSQNSDSSLLVQLQSPQLAASSSGDNFIYLKDGGKGTSRSWFTYEELSIATNRFSENNLLGEGGFGYVYKGVLVDGREVAVKKLTTGGVQGEREFQAEVEIISRIHHRHLVSLVGYCIFEHQRLLVYDYVPNDTLYYHLHAEDKPVMDWASRVKVAAGAARGLTYLHEECQPRIIHRDIKSSNILLDNNFEARVSDFGLAKLAFELDLHTHVSTRVMGTFGYLAPEYASTGKLNEKSDVFSFGVVLLELITGRKPIDAAQPLGDESLVEWARPLLARSLETKDFSDLVDPRLDKNVLETEIFRMVEAASACVRHSATRRPRMRQIVRALDLMNESVDLSNGMKPGQSGIHDSRNPSAAQIRIFRKMAFGGQDFSSDFYSHSLSNHIT